MSNRQFDKEFFLNLNWVNLNPFWYQYASDLQDVGKEVEQIKISMGAGVDASFDCVGFNKTISTALSATCAGGRVCLVGLGQSEMTLPLTEVAGRYLIYIFLRVFFGCQENGGSGKICVCFPFPLIPFFFQMLNRFKDL